MPGFSLRLSHVVSPHIQRYFCVLRQAALPAQPSAGATKVTVLSLCGRRRRDKGSDVDIRTYVVDYLRCYQEQ